MSSLSTACEQITKGPPSGYPLSVAVPVVSTALILRKPAKFSFPMDDYTELLTNGRLGSHEPRSPEAAKNCY